MTPVAILTIFIVILVISLIGAASTKNYSSFDGTSFHTFLVIFSSLGFILTFVLLYSVVTLQQSQQQLAIIEQTAKIGDTIHNNVYDEISRVATSIPSFVYSINPIGSSKIPQPPPDESTSKNMIEKNVLAAKIFNVWQLVTVSDFYTAIDTHPFVTNSLQRANSRQLYAIWKIQKINYNKKVQQLGDIFFEYALLIEEQTTETYIKAAEEVLIDPRFREIRSC